MNIINKKSSLAPLFENVINSLSEKSNTKNNKFFSYKNIFNKSILWVKLYDNYLYNYLNKNINKKFCILEPKTKENKTLAIGNSPTLASVTEAVNKKVQISKNTIKYKHLNACPIISNGYSTGFAPIHVNTIKYDTIVQNNILKRGLNFEVLILNFLNGRIMMIKIDRRRATTPPNLLGIERRIAYANKKYHSGWIWMGVFNGFAGLKFSGSPILLG